MKKVLLILVSLCSLSLGAIAAGEIVVGEEAQAVVESLKYPQNLSAEMLKAAIGKAKAKKLNIEALEVKKMQENSYQVSFRLNNKNTSEIAQVNVSEVRVLDGTAYVFGFEVERIVKMNKYP